MWQQALDTTPAAAADHVKRTVPTATPSPFAPDTGGAVAAPPAVASVTGGMPVPENMGQLAAAMGRAGTDEALGAMSQALQQNPQAADEIAQLAQPLVDTPAAMNDPGPRARTRVESASLYLSGVIRVQL